MYIKSHVGQGGVDMSRLATAEPEYCGLASIVVFVVEVDRVKLRSDTLLPMG